MLQFYYNRISGNARRVWIALLEKKLDFELISLNLDGDQFQSDFLALNPFHHVPVLVDDGFKVIESLAILDYLEAKYPTPALMPTEAKSVAKVRMVELITLHELVPANYPLMRQMVGLEVDVQKKEQAQKQIATVLSFYEDQLSDRSYFVEGQFTLADIVAGNTVSFLSLLGVSLDNYPKVKRWHEELQQRESWQQTAPKPQEIEAAKPKIRAILEKI